MTIELTSRLLRSDSAVGTWTLDPARSTVRLLQKGLWGLGTVKLTFTDFQGSGEIGAGHSVTGIVTLGSASIDSKNPTRDGHLRGARFLDAEKHPEIAMIVKSARPAGPAIELAGELVIKGVREPVTLTAEVAALTADTLTAHVTGRVDRHRFGVSGNQLGMIVGRTTIDADAVFTRA